MARLFIILALLSFSSFEKKNVKSKDANVSEDNNQLVLNLKAFEFTIYDDDYSLSYALQYILTDKNLKIIFKGELEGEKDSILFKTDFQPNETLNQLSNINFDKLQENYINPCIKDGSQLTVKLYKDNKTKTVHLSNFYHPDIGHAIELINSLIPKKFQIWYDKATLVKAQENCK